MFLSGVCLIPLIKLNQSSDCNKLPQLTFFNIIFIDLFHHVTGVFHWVLMAFWLAYLVSF